MASRRIEDLDPMLQIIFAGFKKKCELNGIDFLVTCTYRSNEEQARLYAQGRTKAGRIVTKTKPGKSKHNSTFADGTPAAKAFDIVILINGKPEWSGAHPHWRKAGKIGTDIGLTWGGNWKGIIDMPHFELPN